MVEVGQTVKVEGFDYRVDKIIGNRVRCIALSGKSKGRPFIFTLSN